MTIRPLSQKSFLLSLAALGLLAGCVEEAPEKQTTADSAQVGPVITVTPVNRDSL